MAERREIEALLPFYANGTLPEAERAEVEAAVAADPALDLELSALRAMRETMQGEDVQGPGEFGLARLMRDVEREGATTERADAQRRSVRLWQVAAGLAAAAFLAQAALLWQPEDTGLRLAGGEGAAALTVAFAPEATEAEIRALLLPLGVEIVTGPSALGLYGLRVPEGTEAESLEALRAAAIVEAVDLAN